MRKFYLVFLSALVLVFGFAGMANAAPFTDIKEFQDVYIGEGPGAQWVSGDSYTYSHNTPGDFEVPYDIVNSATIDIAGYWIDDNNDRVEVNGTAVGTLEEGGEYQEAEEYWSWSDWSWVYVEGYDNPSLTNLDISGVFSSWETGSPLNITITGNGEFGDGWLELDSSTLTLDYENGTAPVPEPATMLLFGSGLLGLAAVRRNRKKS